MSMKVYVVIEIGEPPRIVGVFRRKKDAERIAGEGAKGRNIIEKTLE